jgi:hypothetical protein
VARSTLGSAYEIKIHGQEELERAFMAEKKEVLAGLKKEILAIGAFVRKDAQSNALAEISNIGPKWSRMRMGVTPVMAYIVPSARNRGGSPRPNLAGLLATAMQEAADKHGAEFLTRVDALIDATSAKNGFL